MSEPDLKAFSLLAELGDEDREALADLLEPVSVRSGRKLFRAGSESEGLALIVQGEVAFESPRSSETWVLGPGSALGTLSLVAVGAHEASATAQTACELLFLERTRFRRLVDDHLRSACRLLEAMIKDLAATTRAALDELSPAS